MPIASGSLACITSQRVEKSMVHGAYGRMFQRARLARVRVGLAARVEPHDRSDLVYVK